MSIEEFEKLRNSIPRDQRELLDKFLHKHQDECHQSIKNEIENDKRHTTLVNMCAYAFSESGPLISTGYHFVTVEPLHRFRTQKGNKIFDLIIYNDRIKKAILIEVKSGISNPRTTLNDLKDQIQSVINHKHELEDEIGGDVSDFEYVICGPPQDIEEVGKTLVDDDSVCLWTADLQYSTLKIYNPLGTKDSEKTGQLIGRKQLHSDPALRERLYEKTKSPGQIVRILPSSHICRILSRIIVGVIQKYLTSSTGQEKRFWMSEMKQVLSEELPKLSDDVPRLTIEISNLAIKIKIIEAEEKVLNSKDSSFRLKIGAKSLKTVETYIEEQYIKIICEEKSPSYALNEYREFMRSNSGSLDYFLKSDK